MSGRNSVRAFLGLGGNIGDPAQAIASALQRLNASDGVTVTTVSSLYRTPPWGKTDQPDFFNAAAEIGTTLLPRELLGLCLEIEQGLKRVRGERWGPRTIDIDILLYDECRIAEEGLEIPHPHMTERAFVMVPLAEIAPELVVEGIRAAERAASLDSAGIRRLPGGNNWWKSPK